MLHPDAWSALAAHSGDALFDFCYIMDFPKALAAFGRHGGPAGWLRWYWREPNRRRAEMEPVLNTIGMAAHYSPNPPWVRRVVRRHPDRVQDRLHLCPPSVRLPPVPSQPPGRAAVPPERGQGLREIHDVAEIEQGVPRMSR